MLVLKLYLLEGIPKDKSFPSGHTCVAFVCAFMYLWYLPVGLSIPLLALASLIGFSRMYLGVHFVSDVFWGIVLALVIDIFSLFLYTL